MAPRGGVISFIIKEVYRHFLPDFISPNDIFIHNSAGTYRALNVRATLHELGIQVMDWPPYSPDLNPIENLWAVLKKEIYKLRPELDTIPDNNEILELLIQTAKIAWQNIEIEVLVHLSDTMKKRVDAVLDA